MNPSNESSLLYKGLERTSALNVPKTKWQAKKKAQDICVEFLWTVGYIHKNLFIIQTNIIHE